jgi:hypothetical protein
LVTPVVRRSRSWIPTSAIRCPEVVNARGFFLTFTPQLARIIWNICAGRVERAACRLWREFNDRDSNANPNADTFVSLDAAGAHYVDGKHQHFTRANGGQSVDGRLGNWFE